MDKKTVIVLGSVLTLVFIINTFINYVYNKQKEGVDINITVNDNSNVENDFNNKDPDIGIGSLTLGGELDKDILVKLSKCKRLHYYFNINGSYSDDNNTKYRFYPDSKQCDLMIDYQKIN